ncbi:MAG: EpsG family protein [Lachnospiraceae bacterium]|nr:EpsG family protein [Lachnospiraceae bacterium]
MKVIPHWDMPSAILYMIMGLCATLSVHYVKKTKAKVIYAIWFLMWTILASYRYISDDIGGRDALNYINFFNNCFREDILTKTDEHFEELFQIITKLIRICTDDYRIYFLLLYGFIVFSFILFVNEFTLKTYNFIPLLLSVIVFLKAYNTLRTSLAIAFILFGLVLLHKKKKITAVIIIISSFWIHRTAILYIAFLPFYYFTKNKTLKTRYGISLVACSSGLIYVIKGWLLTSGEWLLDKFDTGLLRTYLVNPPFSRAALLIQMSSFVMMSLLHQDLYHSLESRRDDTLHMVYRMVFFDFIMIPVYTTCGIWRAPEYFFLPRLVMWGYLIPYIKKKFTSVSRYFVSVVIAVIVIGVFIYYLYISWESSALMPYIFERTIKM